MEKKNSVPRVVVIGAGFAGLMTARNLAKAPVEVLLIDRSNHHLFQPLLYQVATASLSPADIAYPIRSALRYQKNAQVRMEEVTGIDKARKEVITKTETIWYDILVVATGARHSYFNHPEWERVAQGLKSIPDATAIRQKILLAFERAEIEPNPVERERLLHFVLVGGGPTGVEMAGAIAELSHRALASDFRHIDPKSARITLVEAGPRILAQFPADLSERATKSLTRLGATVRVNARAEKIDEQGIYIGGQLVGAANVFWTAGVEASPAARWLNATADKQGRVMVEPDLTLKEFPEIFVIGDTACVLGKDGKSLPGVAPVAMQQGRYVAKSIATRVKQQAPPPPFEYRDKGNLATIGRSSAVAEMGRIHLSGWLAWVAWLIVHIYYLIGFRNRVAVILEWAWAYLTFQRGARLIVGDPPAQ